MTSSNKDHFEKFRAKREELRRWFDSTDGNSIEFQILNMVHDVGAYRIINAARTLTKKGEDGQPEFSPLLHNLLDKCFFESLAIAIRRLLDPRKDVYSLRRALDEIEENSDLFTRENMLEDAGLDYDYEKAEAEWVRANPVETDGRGSPTGQYSQNYARKTSKWESAKELHERIDRLCGIKPDDRKPDDKIRRCVIAQMKDGLRKQGGEVRLWVNKFVAHAATEESRKKDNPEERQATVGHLWKAQETICRVATYVYVVLLGGPDGSYFAVPTYNYLRYIESPLVSSEQLGVLKNEWDKYGKEVESWSRWDLALPFQCTA